jgi:hypothetical protein
MASECASVSIKYKGDGSQVLYTFPFTYMSDDDIVAFLYNETTEQWVDQANKFVFANATTIEFLTAPPAPVEDIDNIWIARKTDLTQMLKEFYPGSAIRAQDLNDNFDQLRLAIQEGRCSLQDGLNQLDELTWNTDETYTYDDQVNQRWVEADDQKLATSDAIRARHDSYVQENVPPNVVYEQTGKLWQNTDDCWTSYWQNSVDPSSGDDSKTWVAYVNTGPRGQQGPQGPPGQSIVGPPGPEGPPGPNGGTFPDAPADGKIYGRKDNDWEEVSAAGGGGGNYNFIAPLQEDGTSVKINLTLLSNA